MATPTQVPAELFAGDTWAWTRELTDYPASLWTSAWYFEKSDFNFSVAGVASVDVHTVTITAATTATYPAGDYRRFLRLTRTADSVVKTPESEIGWVKVKPDPAAAGNVDHRTPARRNLDMIDAYLSDQTNLQAASYSLGGRSLSRWSRADLLVERDKWKAEARSEEAAEGIAAGLGNPRRLYVRFDRG